jgi:branched-chain amino acid transport system ATP-binding protein
MASTWSCPRGEVTLLLGRNGAGKTTTLRTIMGLWRASKGRLTFAGRRHHGTVDARDRRAQHRLRAGKHGHLFRPDGAREHVARRAQCGPRTARWTGQRLEWIFGLFPAVQKFWNHPAGKLSGGQKQMLAVASARSSNRANC